MKDPRVYLAHILECAERIEVYTKDGKDSFFSDTMAQDAVLRNFEIIGEAAKRVPGDFQAAHPEIPWRGMASMRNLLIHEYEGVDLHQVWQVVERELPLLKSAISRLLPPLKDLEAELAGEDPEVTQ